MKRYIISLLISIVAIGQLYSQYDPQFSQYMFNVSSYNPAAVGEEDLIQIGGTYRVQWADTTQGFGATTSLFNVNTPLKIGGRKHGVGIRFTNDKIGLLTNNSTYLQYAYKRNLLGGLLSAGVDIGFVSVEFAGTKLKNPTLGTYYNFDNDDAIPKTDVSGNRFDLGLGIYYSNPAYYLGLSYSHLTAPLVSLNDKVDFRVRGTMYLTGGYRYSLPETKFALKPVGLIKTDFTSTQIDISCLAELDSRYWGGLGYRFQDALVFLVGINVASGLSIGYSFDLPTSKIFNGSLGSHEVTMNYSFAYLTGKKNSRYKSIRIM